MTDTKEAPRVETTPPSPPAPVLAIVVKALSRFQLTAASRSRTEASRQISRSSSNINQAAIISNNGMIDLNRLSDVNPASGRYSMPPPTDVASIPSPAEAFKLWQASPDSPASAKNIEFKDLTSGLAKSLAKWIEANRNLTGYNAGYFIMRSTGAGVEAINAYRTDALIAPNESKTEPLVFVFYLNNPFIGPTEAGGFITSETEFSKRYDPGRDPELKRVIDFIQDNNLYSSGYMKSEKYRMPAGTAAYVYELSYQGEEVTTFDICRMTS